MFADRGALTVLGARLRAVAAQRRAVAAQSLDRPIGFSAGARTRVLLVSLPEDIPQAQIHPFHYYARELAGEYGAEILEIGLTLHLNRPEFAQRGADVVCFQAWIDRTPEELRAMVGVLRQVNPDAKLVFLDSFAPSDLRYAAALGPLVDLYVKKHVLRDRTRYGIATAGDTNLTDWYGQRYGIAQEPVCFDIPAGFLSKLVVGPSFAAAPYLLGGFASGRRPNPSGRRRFDLHARIGGAGGGHTWYERMRVEALAAVGTLGGIGQTPTGHISHWAYLVEMAQAKICFSPFGYGEVCYRDYEAVYAGALLLKPDMNQIETDPDIFVDGQTYVSMAWDFSDLADKLRHYLDRPEQIRQISQRAFDVLHRYAASGEFVRQMRPLLAR